MLYREAGQFKTSYDKDAAIFPILQDRIAMAVILVVAFAIVPFVALKALPVLILGGFDSIPGAIVGGLIIGASEKLAEVYLGPFVGGGIESWFPYVLALGFLLIRPEGLFGEKIIRRI